MYKFFFAREELMINKRKFLPFVSYRITKSIVKDVESLAKAGKIVLTADNVVTLKERTSL
jgi:uncharacterized NAD(P)/FAD-binding protein YdhS